MLKINNRWREIMKIGYYNITNFIIYIIDGYNIISINTFYNNLKKKKKKKKIKKKKKQNHRN